MPLRLAVAVLLVALPALAAAQDTPELAEARARHNAGDFDGAIEAAAVARAQPAVADAASLVIGRAYLERYRATAEPVDLASGREALASVNAAALGPDDRLAWLVGIGQSLFYGGQPGAAAEIFETALGQRGTLAPADARMLLDWWASALDGEASAAARTRRLALFERIRARMEEELASAPGSAPANYWLVAAARGAGDLERAWSLAAAAWVRARLAPDTVSSLRADVDTLVLDGIVPALARARGVGEATLAGEWAAFKDLWP